MALGELRENILDVTGQASDAIMATALHHAKAEADNDDLLGVASRSKSGIQNKGAALAKSVSEARQSQEERSRKAMNDYIFMDLVNRIDDLNRQLDGVRANIKTLDAQLRAEYGEDYMEVMAQTYLSDEELESLDGLNPAQRKNRIKDMLRDKMLNEDGTIKEEYKGLTIAELIEQLEKEEVLQTRVDKLEVARESGDPEVIKKAMGDDEHTDDVGRNLAKAETGEKLQTTFTTAVITGDQQKIEIGNAVENRDVEENADTELAFSSFDDFSAG